MVSVCMGTKDGAAFIGEQLESILAQLNGNDEVIVADDRSSDDTLKVIRSFRDRRIRVLESPPSERGIARTFQASLMASRGEFIFLADQDDVWLPEKVGIMKAALAEYDLVVSDCQLVDDNLRIKSRSFYDRNRSGRGLFRNLVRNSYMGCCMAFTRKLMDRALPFPADVPIHDFWIGLIGELYFNVLFLPDVLVLHRRHGSNASTSGEASRRSINERILYRYQVVKNLFIHKYYAG